MAKKYNFYVDSKMTVWTRDSFQIEAESEEEAKILAKDKFNNDDYYDYAEQETLYDTMEPMYVEENDGQSTKELFFGTKGFGQDEMISDNRPIQIIRDEKIDKILDGDK